jgi:hypothetical protein
VLAVKAGAATVGDPAGKGVQAEELPGGMYPGLSPVSSHAPCNLAFGRIFAMMC